MRQTLVEHLAHFVSETRYDDLPSAAKAYAKMLLLDFLGCAIAGTSSTDFLNAIRMLGSIDGVGNNTIWAYKNDTSLQNAVFGNSVAGHALLLADAHRESKLHPSVPIIPSAFAIAESRKLSGKELIAGIVSGYEVMIRVGMALSVIHHRNRGFWATGTCGSIGVAAAVSNILGFDETKAANAMSIAATKMAGLWAFKEDGSSSVLSFDGAFSAQAGIMSALLAKMGAQGPRFVLEATDGGFLRALSDKPIPSLVKQSLGRKFETTRVAIKKYACSRGIHGAIDGLLEITEVHSLTALDIKEIEVLCNSTALRQYRNAKPVTPLAARISLPFCLALAVLDRRKLSTTSLRKKELGDSRYLNLAKRVKMVSDAEIERLYPKVWATEVKVRTFAGKTYRKRTMWPKGEPENPLTDSEIEEKFVALAGNVIKADKTSMIMKRVLAIDNSGSMGRLSALLGP